jgi:hypothetical protein
MKKIRFLALLSLLCIFTIMPVYPSPREGSGQEGRPKRVLQTYLNATLVVTDMRKSAAKLQEIVRQYNGTIQNMSADSNNMSGSATVQIPPDKATAFMGELSALGEIQNQSLSTSDYTNQCEDYARKLKVYKALAQIPPEKIFATINLPESDKTMIHTEFQTMVRSQIESCRSSLTSYERYGDFAQVSLSFRKQDRSQPCLSTGVPTHAMTVQVEEKKGGNEGALITLISIAVAVNFIFLLVLYRKIMRSPLGS